MFLCCLTFISAPLSAATTGKIAGKVIDKETGEPLPGANVTILDTRYGAATDVDGDFYIINVPPGRYSVKATMMGYGAVEMADVLVSINSTANLRFEMSPEVIEGETVTVTASLISYKKDQTSSVRHVSSEQIEILPLENLGDVISMQAGVVEGHFRGGRLGEVSYMIDGVPVDDSFGGTSSTVTIENDVVKDLEVITGTFNAEYGRAMSGIVNAVTKDGGEGYHGRIYGQLGNYFTTNTDLFVGLKAADVRNQDYRLQLEGPILRNTLSFFVNYRYQNNKNHLNGMRRFLVTDYSNYSSDNPAEWLDTQNGDSAYVAMNSGTYNSFFGKLTYSPIPDLKISGIFTHDNDEWGGYSHTWKYNPDGRARNYKTNNMYALYINHGLGANFFHEIKLTYVDNYNGDYLFENPLDPRYIHDRYANSSGPGFMTGGQEKGHSVRTQKDLTVKYDATWQVSKNHSLKAGALYIDHKLSNEYHTILNRYRQQENEYDYKIDEELNTYIFYNYAPEILGDSTLYGEVYDVNPREFSGYLQDKMEFDEMVINLGVRYDMFDPNTKYPSNLRNPANQLRFPDNPERMSNYPNADAKVQLSPRFGLSYQLSGAALLHFSYGHFFQAPPMYAFYQNHSLLVAPTDYATQTGNPQLEAQKTVQYEVGLWQEIVKGMGLEVNLFYRDIYDLLSMKVVSTYNQIEYGVYTNKDYGNVKGLEVKYDVRYSNFNAFINYTLQYTRGNADNPTQTFTRAGDSRDPIARLIPMSWDQRHTVALGLNYGTKKWSTSLTGYYDDGTPYTWAPIAESRLTRVNLYPNNAKKPAKYRLDFYGFYDFDLSQRFKLRASLYIENLLDRQNELFVNGNTGRANEAIVRDVDLANHRSLFNDYLDRVVNPAAIEAPRFVKLGLALIF
ncbi:TonB-dependent receptor [candidate division KSB1 bacterium]|nr:TonB-dependent receptor [candidate division KSB1 bacterium]RQW02861.1 MAG: TonB-dependent receptor [candidate division KSB1 bacterium]